MQTTLRIWIALSLGAVIVIAAGSLIGAGSVWAQDAPTPTALPVADPVEGVLDEARVAAVDLYALPLVPEIGENALAIYANGLARGSDPRSFIKVGDCMTDNPYFLRPLGAGDYALGEYADLQPVIDHYAAGAENPFARLSQAAAGGFNAASLLDSLWANPEFCEAGETPLACELRLMQPSVALIMFGTNDVFYLDAAQFDYFLRGIVAETIRGGALPVLSTFPHRPEFPDKAVLYNQVVVRIAEDYDVPLINLWRALEPLPNQGVDPEETTHMSAPASGAVCHFIGENLQAGFTVRNLLTLQTLDALLQAAGRDAAPES